MGRRDRGPHAEPLLGAVGFEPLNRVNRKGCVAAGAVGCESACARFGTGQYCCRGARASRSACNPAQWPVDYAAVFKKAEPYAYSYADDDATSTFVCRAGVITG